MTQDRNGGKSEPLEETDDAAKLYVADPDDYAKTRKLKAIQDAKDNYKRYTTDEAAILEKFRDTWGNPNEALKSKRAEALALYGSELLPLIEEALQNGALAEDDLQVETDELTARVVGKAEMDVRDVIDNRGIMWVDGETKSLPKKYQNRVYRQLERIERKIGLGLTLEEDADDEWEITT